MIQTMSEERVDVSRNPHDLVIVRTNGNDAKLVSVCMLDRLSDDDLVNGLVPDDMPEWNDPSGSYCHNDWRGGCPEGFYD